MKTKPPRVRIVAVLSLVVVLLAAARVDAAITLQFDYRYDTTHFFDAGTEARDCLTAVADFYNAVLDDDLTAINSVAGTNQFNLNFTRPDTGVSQMIPDFDVPINTVVIFVGARELGDVTLGEGGPGGWIANYSSSTWFTNAKTRGESYNEDDVSGPTAIEFAPWGGPLAVDINTAWHYDQTRKPGASTSDLYSVLVHETAHILGFGLADSWNNKVNGSNYFTGAASAAEYGGNVPLDSSGGHWANDPTSPSYADGPSQQAAMAPALTVGTRKRLTRLDAAGLDDIGWTLHPVSYWTAASGSVFGTGGNWSTGASPTARDFAVFDNSGAYTITFSSNHESQQLEVENGDVTFNLGTRNYKVDDLIVSTTGASLEVTSGTLQLVRQGIVETSAALSIGSGGVFQLDGGLDGSVTLASGGVLTGEGYVGKNVYNGGQLRPGDSAGELAIAQSYVQQVAGSLAIELGGRAQGVSYDSLDVAGLATLNGTLQIDLIGGFSPSVGDSFEIMTYGSRSGIFSTLSGNSLSNGLTLVPDYGGTSLTLRTIKMTQGDANLDGLVNNADAAILASHWHQASGAAWSDGDFNNDGAVNDRDASILAAHWGQVAEGLRAVVPEPGCLIYLASTVLCGSFLFLIRRHGR